MTLLTFMSISCHPPVIAIVTVMPAHCHVGLMFMGPHGSGGSVCCSFCEGFASRLFKALFDEAFQSFGEAIGPEITDDTAF
jgi:hypothetical protein